MVVAVGSWVNDLVVVLGFVFSLFFGLVVVDDCGGVMNGVKRGVDTDDMSVMDSWVSDDGRVDNGVMGNSWMGNDGGVCESWVDDSWVDDSGVCNDWSDDVRGESVVNSGDWVMVDDGLMNDWLVYNSSVMSGERLEVNFFVVDGLMNNWLVMNDGLVMVGYNLGLGVDGKSSALMGGGNVADWEEWVVMDNSLVMLGLLRVDLGLLLNDDWPWGMNNVIVWVFVVALIMIVMKTLTSRVNIVVLSIVSLDFARNVDIDISSLTVVWFTVIGLVVKVRSVARLSVMVSLVSNRNIRRSHLSEITMDGNMLVLGSISGDLRDVSWLVADLVNHWLV